MNFKNTLLSAAALYAIGRMGSEINLDDVRKWSGDLTGITTDELRRYAMRLTDDALFRIGLQRSSTVASSAALVIGGVTAGLVVGAGAAWLLASEKGRGLREKISQQANAMKSNGSERVETAAS